MELFKNIRLKIGKFILLKKVSKTKRKMFYSDITLVKSIGILWDSRKPEDFVALSRFHQKMNERNITVNILGYFNGIDLPDKYTAIRYMTFIRRKELNFFYHPVSPESITFIKKKYDVLIDLNFSKVFPLHFIAALSEAAFKIGLFESDNSDQYFDMMMEIKQPVNLDDYLQHIIKYLEMINSNKAKTVNN